MKKLKFLLILFLILILYSCNDNYKYTLIYEIKYLNKVEIDTLYSDDNLYFGRCYGTYYIRNFSENSYYYCDEYPLRVISYKKEKIK